MLVSFNWLKEFVDIEQTAEEIADALTMSGTEIEGLVRVGHTLDNVVTARIEEITPHPSAEKLRLARITFGDREAVVVCGAPNIAVGQIVSYAMPGAVLPNGLEITERDIRGFSSPGMICSEKELDLGEDASGILILGDDTPVGLPLAEAIPEIDDRIFEASVTPNRGDCLSILGIAREVAALTGAQVRLPPIEPAEDGGDISELTSVEVPDADLCPRYVVRMVEGVKIGPSPFQVRLRLHRSGVRPISNVVDATNLILLECGQPLHAFDYSLLEEGRIVVRRADPGEVFTTLDGVERKMPENALMIRDGKRSVALAGIMGGLNSEIQENTTTVLIESACFERFGVRRTAKALGMSTEACFRFERGVDPEGTLWAAHRAARVINDLAGGSVRRGVVDVYPEPIRRPAVPVAFEKVNRVLGVDLSQDDTISSLERLGIRVERSSEDAATARPPSWRWDLERDVDMIEEVARVYGFDNIPVTMPTIVSAPDRSRETHTFVDRVGRVMNASGFTEVISMSFVSERQAGKFAVEGPDAPTVRLLNPLTEETAAMRRSLIPGLLASVRRNLSFRSSDLRLYEIGRVFTPVPGEELPREDLKLAGAACGSVFPELWHFQRGTVDERGNVRKRLEIDFYDVKGGIENLLEDLGIESAEFVPSGTAFLHPGKSADLKVEGSVIGYLGELTPAHRRDEDIDAKVQIFEIFLEPLQVLGRREKIFRPLPRYPYVERDLAIIVEEKVSGDAIKRLISRLGHDIISSVNLFDLYRGKNIREGHKSLAFRIRYQSEDRTLTDEEVQDVHAQVMETLKREVGAAARE